jgi:hypothetical protein
LLIKPTSHFSESRNAAKKVDSILVGVDKFDQKLPGFLSEARNSPKKVGSILVGVEKLGQKAGLNEPKREDSDHSRRGKRIFGA